MILFPFIPNYFIKLFKKETMKKTMIFGLCLILAIPVMSQEKKDTTYWKSSGNISVNFSELSFSNWAAGGKSSISGVGLINYSAIYSKDKINWENNFNFGYGLIKEGKNDVTKSEDKIDINSKLGLKSSYEKLLYTALFNFRTQFANGYNYLNTINRISGFMAPAYLNLSIGIDYKPFNELSFFMSPVSGKVIIVNDKSISQNYGLKPGSISKGEFGAMLKCQLKTPVVKNVDIDTQISLFSNYFDKPQNIDVLWDLVLNMKINNFLSASFIANLIYDDNIKIKVDKNNDGIIDGEGPRIQFKQLLGIGFNYKF
jgi:hypothetical protein